MIPISQNDRLKIEVKGITFSVKPLTGDNEIDYIEISSRLKKGEITRREEFAILNDLFDFFCVGWDGPGVPKFPVDSRPSSYLNAETKNKVIERASSANILSGEETKN
jgi:hypothetical protein